MKAVVVIKKLPHPTLNTLEQFVKIADEANIHLNSIDKIKTLINECHLWNEKFEQMQQGEHYPCLSSYEQLYEQARHFHIDLEPLKLIEQTILQVRSLLEKTQTVFRRPDSNLTLIEVEILNKNVHKILKLENVWIKMHIT
ncbi:unnamed protein product [Rotaria sp. Silwood1]|nr:unnamed protein product [Rotaria sp. Silwood1]